MSLAAAHPRAARHRSGARRAPAGLRAPALLLLASGLLAGCAQTPPPLYHWGTFPRMQYNALQQPGAPLPDQLGALEAQAAKASGSGQALPPGFRAHWGLLQLSAGNADEARRLWLAEKDAFPESAAYMDQLLKRLDGPKGTPP